jgi:hypothetical protein
MEKASRPSLRDDLRFDEEKPQQSMALQGTTHRTP